MEIITVKDWMVPLDEYATVSEDATLFDAVMALEKAQAKLDRKRYLYLHRAVLVYDKNNKIVGKISQLDALRALEPKYEQIGDSETLSRAGFSPAFLTSMMKKHALWTKPLKSSCTKGATMIVKTFMHRPAEGEFIDEGASLEQALHLMVMGNRQSLLVTKDKDIVGILRMTDVFREVFQIMKHCEI